MIWVDLFVYKTKTVLLTAIKCRVIIRSHEVVLALIDKLYSLFFFALNMNSNFALRNPTLFKVINKSQLNINHIYAVVLRKTV